MWFARRCGEGACETEERSDSTDLTFLENGTLARQSHINPDGSHWTADYDYQYKSDHVVQIRRTTADALSIETYEYDDGGRVCRVFNESTDGRSLNQEYLYDAAGLKSKTQYLSVPAGTVHMCAIDGSDTHYPAKGAAAITTFYNERDQPAEVRIHDDAKRVLSRVELKYDADGHLLEELQARSVDGWADALQDAPLNERDALRVIWQSVSEPILIQHRYDDAGRRVETRRKIGLMNEEIVTKTYNVQGDKITETSEERSREYGVDEAGVLSPAPESERVDSSEARFHYTYDEAGNWVEQVVENRSSGDTDFSKSTIEARAIEYFTDETI